VRREVVGFCAYSVLRLTEISESDCNRLCAEKICKALCYQGFGSVP
jgi:hypothetical protein